MRLRQAHGMEEVAESLLKAKADPDCDQTESSCSALLMAARDGHVAILGSLINAGADPNFRRALAAVPSRLLRRPPCRCAGMPTEGRRYEDIASAQWLNTPLCAAPRAVAALHLTPG